ncbi:MAG: hypothetical protein IT328_23725 [Caldilineaceae bacterium]|nr:hypothetical protein [Caldilineaceae bacterium]
MAVDEVLCKELIAFNHPYVWHCALSVMLGPKNEQLLQELSTHIATANERHVKEFAYLGTAGILAGYDQLLTVIRKYPTTPLREATLTALEKYPLQIAEDTEIPLRITAVLGTAEHENIGTFGTALSSYVDEILVGQAIFLDMLRVYGSYFVKNNSISNGGFRFHPA